VSIQALAGISRSALSCHSSETHAPIANSPNNAQLEGTPYHSPSYIWVHAVVWERGKRQTDRNRQDLIEVFKICNGLSRIKLN